VKGLNMGCKHLEPIGYAITVNGETYQASDVKFTRPRYYLRGPSGEWITLRPISVEMMRDFLPEGFTLAEVEQ
jgi:hypothetical protein